MNTKKSLRKPKVNAETTKAIARATTPEEEDILLKLSVIIVVSFAADKMWFSIKRINGYVL